MKRSPPWVTWKRGGDTTFEQRARAAAQNRRAAEFEDVRARELAQRDPQGAANARQLAEVFRGNAEYLERASRELADG